MTRGSVRKAFRADTLGIDSRRSADAGRRDGAARFEPQWRSRQLSILGAIVFGRVEGRVGRRWCWPCCRWSRRRATCSGGPPRRSNSEVRSAGARHRCCTSAELYAWVILLLGYSRPPGRSIARSSSRRASRDDWPTVDVYIPTYNESLEIVRNHRLRRAGHGLSRATGITVFILDDGRRPEFRAFARAAGCGYITRADNRHAKAGNLNDALKKTDGELIAIFDCDHVPTRAFLQMTVGWFQRDRKLALLQTPHHFYSPDPFERNLGTVRDVPNEGDLFYGVVQDGNDLWNATFFCGSCAVIRRAALDEIDGFAGRDGDRGRAHRAASCSAWAGTPPISAPQAAGLATERLVLHIGQRIRWARGMTQIFRIDNPLLGHGPEPGAAALLPERDAALPVSAAAHRLPDRAAGVSALRRRTSSTPPPG